LAQVKPVSRPETQSPFTETRGRSRTLPAESGFRIWNVRPWALLVALSILFAPSMSPAQILEIPLEIPAGVMEFEDSSFCSNHSCLLESIEPLRFRGAIECWFYNYLHYRNKSHPPTQFGIRLSNEGNRDAPHMILRWFPVTRFDDIDFAAMNDYLLDLVGESAQRVIPFAREYAKTQLSTKKKKLGSVSNSRKMKVGNYSFSCTYTQGKPPRYPQFTLVVLSD
jgi:hypothetical protein